MLLLNVAQYVSICDYNTPICQNKIEGCEFHTVVGYKSDLKTLFLIEMRSGLCTGTYGTSRSPLVSLHNSYLSTQVPNINKLEQFIGINTHVYRHTDILKQQYKK